MSFNLLDYLQTSVTDRVFAYMGNTAAWIGVFTDPSLWTVMGGVGVSGATILYFIIKAMHERQKMIQEQERHELEMERERHRNMEEDMYG